MSPWCALCQCEVHEDALRCGACGVPLRGPEAIEPSPDPPVRYGKAPAVEGDLGLELLGYAIEFGGARERSD